MCPHPPQHQFTRFGAHIVLPPLRAFPLLTGFWHCRPCVAPGWAHPVRDLCANTVAFDANRAITAAGRGGRGLQVTVPSWPCAARASTMSGEHKPRAVWGGWGSASPVVCAALMLSGVGAPGWGVSRLGQGNAWQVLLLHKRNMASGVREVCARQC